MIKFEKKPAGVLQLRLPLFKNLARCVCDDVQTPLFCFASWEIEYYETKGHRLTKKTF